MNDEPKSQRQIKVTKGERKHAEWSSAAVCQLHLYV